MGANRREHKNKSPTEVSKRLDKMFNVRKKDLYALWLAYNNRVVLNKNPRMTIKQLQSHPEMYSDETMNYFMAMGFEFFNKEYLKEIKIEH